MVSFFEAINYSHREFTLQWHITNECDYRCRHCYIPHSRKKSIDSDQLNTKVANNIIKELFELGKKWNIKTRINFSGGNPILSPQFWNLATYASSLGIRIGILGNPSSILDRETAERLQSIPIFRYQISIDGTKKTHDRIRGEGSFDDAVKSLKVMKKMGIPSVVMTTVTRDNLCELINTAKTAFDNGVTVFDFSRIVPTGESEDWGNLIPKPNEYRAALLELFYFYKELSQNRNDVYIGSKDPLWMLLYYELGLLKPKPVNQLPPKRIYGGCSIGINALSIDVDFTVYSCRRLEIPIGNLKTESIYDIFLKSKELNSQRNFSRLVKCRDCDLMPVCRGCRAIAYSNSQDYFEEDPTCWR